MDHVASPIFKSNKRVSLLFRPSVSIVFYFLFFIQIFKFADWPGVQLGRSIENYGGSVRWPAALVA